MNVEARIRVPTYGSIVSDVALQDAAVSKQGGHASIRFLHQLLQIGLSFCTNGTCPAKFLVTSINIYRVDAPVLSDCKLSSIGGRRCLAF